MSRLPGVTYNSASEIQEDSKVIPESMEDGDIETLIQLAEGHIDDYVGLQEHHPDDTNVDRVFPRVEDVNETSGLPEVPLAVYEATLRQVEYLYLNWWDEKESKLLPMSHDLKAYSVTGEGGYSEQRAKGGSDHSAGLLCEQAKAKLVGFRANSAELVLESVSLGSDALSSRML